MELYIVTVDEGCHNYRAKVWEEGWFFGIGSKYRTIAEETTAYLAWRAITKYDCDWTEDELLASEKSRGETQ